VVRYKYICEICDEQETLSFGWTEDAPQRMDCKVCGATDKMVRQVPKTASHFHPTKTEAKR